jgi:hypothetical protein
MDSATAHEFRYHFSAVQAEVKAGVVPSRATAADQHWRIWTEYCLRHSLDPTLEGIEDPVPFIQIFAYKYRHGLINPSQKQVRSRTVEDAVRSVGQTFAAMGSPDPRLTPAGKHDFRLRRQYNCYAKADPPPNRVKPIPLPILRHILQLANASTDSAAIAIADMIVIAFFFLLRPGEYTVTTDNSPFRLQDIQLRIGDQRLSWHSATEHQLLCATFATLEFTTQKNAVRGEVIGQGRSGSHHFCPVKSIARRLLHLRRHGADPATPLASYFSEHRWCPIKPADISDILKLATTALGSAYGFTRADVSARSLRASGAMALLNGGVDTDIIRLIGRWRSDEMLRYLHVQAEPLMRGHSSLMLSGGDYTLHPNSAVPLY